MDALKAFSIISGMMDEYGVEAVEVGGNGNMVEVSDMLESIRKELEESLKPSHNKQSLQLLSDISRFRRSHHIVGIGVHADEVNGILDKIAQQ